MSFEPFHCLQTLYTSRQIVQSNILFTVYTAIGHQQQKHHHYLPMYYVKDKRHSVHVPGLILKGSCCPRITTRMTALWSQPATNCIHFFPRHSWIDFQLLSIAEIASNCCWNFRSQIAFLYYFRKCNVEDVHFKRCLKRWMQYSTTRYNFPQFILCRFYYARCECKTCDSANVKPANVKPVKPARGKQNSLWLKALRNATRNTAPPTHL